MPVAKEGEVSLFGEEIKSEDEVKEGEEIKIPSIEEALKALEPGAREKEGAMEEVVGYGVVEPVLEKAEIPLAGVEEKAKKEPKEEDDLKTPVVEGKALKIPEPDAREKETVTEEIPGYYVVKKTDTLSAIAAREDVYGDSLKWPVLYRLNMDNVGISQLGEDLSDKKVPEGLRLKIVSPDEAKANLEKRSRSVWVVNALSTTSNEKIVPAAVSLIKNGYTVYLVRAKVKGKDWMRLRVGFFENKSKANTEAEKIKAILNLGDTWVAKIGKKELEEFGSY
jgi:LysM repeat protein